jgi:hypothetical protein
MLGNMVGEAVGTPSDSQKLKYAFSFSVIGLQDGRGQIGVGEEVGSAVVSGASVVSVGTSVGDSVAVVGGSVATVGFFVGLEVVGLAVVGLAVHFPHDTGQRLLMRPSGTSVVHAMEGTN